MLNSLFSDQPNADVLEKLLLFTRRFYRDHGVTYDCLSNCDSISNALIFARHSLRKLPRPSIFKKAAVFTHVFVLYAPITTELPTDFYPPELKRRFYHNAVIAYQFCVASLNGATIETGDAKEPTKRLDFPIKISRHQHREFMTALCEINEMKDTYARFIALIYETLAYEFNDGVRYKDWHDDTALVAPLDSTAPAAKS